MEDEFERRPGMSFTGLKRLVFNILTVLLVLTTVCVVIGFIAVFINPYMSINPFPPPTLPATLGSPTATFTPAKPLPSPWTPTATSIVVESTGTPVPPTASATPTATEVEEVVPPFALQVGSPALIQNFLNDEGCEYMAVFGNVFDLNDSPIIDLHIHLAGELEGVPSIDLWAVSGSATEVGQSGYLINVADHPIASEGTLWVQLEDGGGNTLSEIIFLDTTDSCSENLIMVNWRQVR
jgi:hypothetical protein